MARTPEGKVKDKVVSILKEHGAYYFFPATGGYGRSGIPDIVCCFQGRFIAFECKAGKNMPTALQAREINAITDAGGQAFVIGEANIYLVSGILKLLRDEVQ